MPRTPVPTMPGGAECWAEVERIRVRLGLSTADLAREMGFKSAGALRARRKRDEMPLEAWRRFVARYCRELDPAEDDDKTVAAGVRLSKTEWAIARRLGGGNKSAGIREALRLVRESLRE